MRSMLAEANAVKAFRAEVGTPASAEEFFDARESPVTAVDQFYGGLRLRASSQRALAYEAITQACTC